MNSAKVLSSALIALTIGSTSLIANSANAGSIAPGPSFAIQNGMGGAGGGTVGYVGGSFQTETRGTKTSDGEGVVGIETGDAVNGVGIGVSYTINSLTGKGAGGRAGDGAINLSVSKQFGQDTFVKAFGDRIVTFGVTDAKADYGIVATKVLELNSDIDKPLSRLAVTAGYGSERSAFGGATLRINKNISVSTEWTGQDLAAGVNVVPFDNVGLAVSAGFRDIVVDKSKTGFDAKPRFVIGVGYGISF